MTPPKAWIQLAANTACKLVMGAIGSMLAETDEILLANIKEMRQNALSVLSMLATAEAIIDVRKEQNDG
jgi:hypothetical protein